MIIHRVYIERYRNAEENVKTQNTHQCITLITDSFFRNFTVKSLPKKESADTRHFL